MSGYLLGKYPWLRQTKLVDAGNFVVARTNCGSAAEAERIADAAVESGLVACANILGPIRSVYRWQDKVERAEEWVVELKTAEPRLLKLMRLVQEHHSYDLPAFYVLPALAGHADYLAWAGAGTKVED